MDTKLYYAIKGNKQQRIGAASIEAFKKKGYEIHEDTADKGRRVIHTPVIVSAEQHAETVAENKRLREELDAVLKSQLANAKAAKPGDAK